MANCPECGEDDFYQPLIGKGECVNLECELFSNYHCKAMNKSQTRVRTKIDIKYKYKQGGWEDYEEPAQQELFRGKYI